MYTLGDPTFQNGFVHGRTMDLPHPSMNPAQTTMETLRNYINEQAHVPEPTREAALKLIATYYETEMEMNDGDETMAVQCVKEIIDELFAVFKKKEPEPVGLHVRTTKCELCDAWHDDEDIVGCCRDGECPHEVENMCKGCATWNEDEEQWVCAQCAEEDEDEDE